MNNPLSQKITIGAMLRFTVPTIIMMVCMSLYVMVDGFFVTNYVGTDALSAVNIVFPISATIIAVGIMLATGGSAVIARKMGQGNDQEAKENFTFIVFVGVVIGILITILGLLFLDQIIYALGSTDILFDYCKSYLGMIIIFTPMSILQMLFQFLFVTAGKANLGLISTIGAGLANIVLDYLLIVTFEMGVAGAALATGIGYSIPALFGLYYFSTHKKGTMHFVKFSFDAAVLSESCFNGMSEMVTNLASAITTFLFNMVMLKYLGEDGVAAITIVLYSQFLLTAVYLGFSSGIAPVFSYNYGVEDKEHIKSLFKYSMIFIAFSSILIFGLSMFFAPSVINVFAQSGTNVFDLALNGFLLFSLSYLFTGVNIFASSMFTAFGNGKVSAIISLFRTFVCIVLAIMILPLMLKVDGVWLAVPFAELVTLIVSIFYIVKLRYKYSYL